MSQLSWRVLFASVAGTSHVKLTLPCQDASTSEVVLRPTGERVLVALVSDGAGSAARADEGARLACELTLQWVRELLASGGSVGEITREQAATWILQLQSEIGARAEAEGLKPRDFACTLVAAVVGADQAAFFQIGDGAIVVSTPEEGDEYGWVFWPESGEYENVTFFVTEPHATERLQHDLIRRPIDEVSLFSDGLQRLLLHYQTRTAHAPFFRSMLGTVRNAEQAALSTLREGLSAYLQSPAVNERTDDDKTLILATRRNPESSNTFEHVE